MEKDSRIYVAGHTGLVGSALVRELTAQGYTNLILRSHKWWDLTSPSTITGMFAKEQPEYVFLAAAKVGGILANSTLPADFIHDNLAIQTNVIHACQAFDVKKLCFFGSSCIYPRDCPQPIKEEYLLTGPLEETNRAYAIAKIAGIEMCQAYRKQYGLNAICLMPTNLYGPNDHFDAENGHVIPALIRRFHDAKVTNDEDGVSIWGSGASLREFIHAEDLADAALFLMQHYNEHAIINVGTGEEVIIGRLASFIAGMVGYVGEGSSDLSKPSGTPRKLLDVSKIHSLGWHHKIELEAGLRATYEWFLEHAA